MKKVTSISNQSIYLFSAMMSIALSCWIPLRETVINPDAICYLLSAQEVGVGGIKSAMHLCGQAKWPFYSVLIYGLSQLTHLSSMISAYIIDGMFSLISVLMFVAIIQELGASRRVMWFAALTILLAHDFNSIRQYIVRDHGFYAFYLVSIFALLRYAREPGYRMALLWSMATMLATIFRIEGAVFLAVMPMAMLFCTRYPLPARLKYFLQLNLLGLMVVLGGVGWLWLHQDASMAQLGRLPELAYQASQGFRNIASYWVRMREGLMHVLEAGAKSQANQLLALVVTFDYIIRLLGTLSLVYMFVIIYAWVSRAALWTRANAVVIVGYVLTNLLITIGFYLQHYFLSKRYLIALSLVLMLWVPYGLDKLLRKAHRRPYRTAFTVAMVWVVIASLGGIFDFGYSKAYIADAGQWLSLNVPKSATIYMNDDQLMYYSNHFDRDLFIKRETLRQTDVAANQAWRRFQYLAIRNPRMGTDKLMALLKQDGLQPVKTFKNKRGDNVAIYRVQEEAAS